MYFFLLDVGCVTKKSASCMHCFFLLVVGCVHFFLDVEQLFLDVEQIAQISVTWGV